MTRLSSLLVFWLTGVLAVTSVHAEEVLIGYSFDRGSGRPAAAAALHANVLSAGSGKLLGISPKEEQLYVLLRQDEETIPATREEAEMSEHCASFSITPMEGKAVTLRRLVFSVGAASVRLSGSLHAVVKGQCGGEDFEVPVVFTRDDMEAGEAYPIRQGDQRDALHGRGEADLSSLPAPLDAPVTFRLYFYLMGADLTEIPAGTNYSIRVDDLQLMGEAM